MNIFGRPKVGKSYGALQLAAAIGDPRLPDWLSFPVLRHGPVTYLQVDTPRELWVERLGKMHEAGYGFDGVHFADAESAPHPFNILRPECSNWLSAELARVQPLLLVVDTFREAHGQNENDSTEMQKVISTLRECARESAILLVSHSRKERTDGFEGGNPMDEIRGSGYVTGRMDTIVRLTDRQMQIRGRAIGDTHIGIRKDPDHHILLLADAFTQAALDLIRMRPAGESDRALARRLQEAFPKKGEEACRSAIRRMTHP